MLERMCPARRSVVKAHWVRMVAVTCYESMRGLQSRRRLRKFRNQFWSKLSARASRSKKPVRQARGTGSRGGGSAQHPPIWRRLAISARINVPGHLKWIKSERLPPVWLLDLYDVVECIKGPRP